MRLANAKWKQKDYVNKKIQKIKKNKIHFFFLNLPHPPPPPGEKTTLSPVHTNPTHFHSRSIKPQSHHNSMLAKKNHSFLFMLKRSTPRPSPPLPEPFLQHISLRVNKKIFNVHTTLPRDADGCHSSPNTGPPPPPPIGLKTARPLSPVGHSQRRAQ